MPPTAARTFVNARIHPAASRDRTAEAVAVRDGRVLRVGDEAAVQSLVGPDTDVVDLDDCVLLPGFVDAHTHLRVVGRRQVHADLGGASGPDECVERLRGARDAPGEWVLGFGYDESEWDGDYLTADDIAAVDHEHPVAAFREDLHVASVDDVALRRLADDLPEDDVRTDETGTPTGVLVEDAAQAVFETVDPGIDGTRELLRAAQDRALELGVTAVHEMVRNDNDPRVYRELDLAGDLDLRVRLNYWSDYLDAVEEVGLRANHGSDRVRAGGIKTFTDGSIGARTARLSEPYTDGDGTERGDWVVDPEELGGLAERVANLDLQLCAHAIGDAAIAETLVTFQRVAGERHRVEHAEVLTDDLIERLADADVVVSMQPNFLKWAREDGLYESRLGPERTRETNRFRELLEAGATLAFGSDCMPLDPLFGIQQAVTAPVEAQRLSVTEALQAYTQGSAYAGHDEDRMGTVEAGKLADFVVLAESPWTVAPDEIADVDVEATVVAGEVVHDARF